MEFNLSSSFPSPFVRSRRGGEGGKNTSMMFPGSSSPPRIAYDFENSLNHPPSIMKTTEVWADFSQLSKSISIDQEYFRAGEIVREVKNEVERRDWRGKTYLELCEFVEAQIRKRGALPAFPCNVCADESAAHYTAVIDDERKIQETTIVKVDIGAHIGGHVVDSAVTLCYNDELLDLAEATKSALNEALKAIRDGGKVSDVGQAVEYYASKRGYVPISNLSGHSLDLFEVHAGTSIPNVWTASSSSFVRGRVYAIEPFLTTLEGSGVVVDGGSENIFSLVARKRTKERLMDEFLDSIWKKCRSLPFALRWFTDEFSKTQLEEMSAKLKRMRLIRSYPELVESNRQPVAQAEHTVGITESGPLVLT
jgi:methionyl aminopeptidase